MIALEQDQRFTLDRDDRWCRAKAGVTRWDLDVAACEESHLAPKYFTAAQDGLRQRWRGRVWVNPPFSSIAPWVAKAWSEMASAIGPGVVAMLLPATRTEQRWWQYDVEPYRRRGPRRLGRCGPLVSLEDHFLPGRTRFGRPGNRHALSKGQVGAELGVGSPDFTCTLLVWTRIDPQTSAGVLS